MSSSKERLFGWPAFPVRETQRESDLSRAASAQLVGSGSHGSIVQNMQRSSYRIVGPGAPKVCKGFLVAWREVLGRRPAGRAKYVTSLRNDKFDHTLNVSRPCSILSDGRKEVSV